MKKGSIAAFSEQRADEGWALLDRLFMKVRVLGCFWDLGLGFRI